MNRLKRYFLEIKKNVEDSSSENGSSQNTYNIILICNDAINCIARNPYDGNLLLLKRFEEIKFLAENAVAEGQHKPKDLKHSRMERIKEIVTSMEKMFETEATQIQSQNKTI